MRILFLDQFSELGGAQRCLLDLMPAIVSRGWSAHAALPAGPLADRLRAIGVAVEEISCGPYRNGRKRVRDAFRWMHDARAQRRVMRRGFDLIYINGPRLLPAAALAARGATPVLFHAHHRIGQPMAATIARASVQRARATVAAVTPIVSIMLTW